MPWFRSEKTTDQGDSPREVKQKCGKCGSEIWSYPSDKRAAMEMHMNMAHGDDDDD